MIFNLFISLIFSNHLNYSVPFRKNPCGSGIQDVLYINKPIDLEYISNCTYINGSLFINGDYNINNLNKLSNIKGINGYLSIYDSHKIKNLKGLHHLKKIKGSNKYLLKYGLTIKYNNPIDNNTGLCYYDKVYWDKIINSPITIFKNKKNCPECDKRCKGCFGPSNLLCQECREFTSGSACVSKCNNGTLQEGNICNEKIPNEELKLKFRRSGDLKLNISWNKPIKPNGYILNYQLLRNNSILFKSYYDNSGYISNTYLEYNYEDSLKELNKNYSYKICYSNSKGKLCSREYNYFLRNLSLSYEIKLSRGLYYSDIHNLSLVNQTNYNTLISWKYKTLLKTPVFEYSLNNIIWNNTKVISKIKKENDLYYLNLSNLEFNHTYNFSILTKNNNKRYLLFRTYPKKIKNPYTKIKNKTEYTENNTSRLYNTKNYIKPSYNRETYNRETYNRETYNKTYNKTKIIKVNSKNNLTTISPTSTQGKSLNNREFIILIICLSVIFLLFLIIIVLCLRKKIIKIEEKQIILYRNPIYETKYQSKNGYITLEESKKKRRTTLYQQIEEDNSLVNNNILNNSVVKDDVFSVRAEKNKNTPNFLNELKLKVPEYNENISI